MILKNDGLIWSYSTQGWDSAFKPITNCSVTKLNVIYLIKTNNFNILFYNLIRKIFFGKLLIV